MMNDIDACPRGELCMRLKKMSTLRAGSYSGSEYGEHRSFTLASCQDFESDSIGIHELQFNT